MKLKLLTLSLSIASIISAQSNWVATNPFKQDAFIENKGQLDTKEGVINSDVLFTNSNDGIDIHLTKKGIIYKHYENVKRTPDEFPNGIRKKGEAKFRRVEYSVKMEWLNANPNAQVITENAVSNYYTYGDLKDKSGKTSIKALAYKKVTYKNLYPGIDLIITKPTDKSGIKYELRLMPGADASMIKMQYTGNVSLSVDSKGNVLITTVFGEITDHAPITTYEYADSHSIASSFTLLNSNTIGFKLEKYNKNQTVIIDPWVAVPVYTGYNGSYEVDYDIQGNVYVYGGTFPWQEHKFNNAGALQWTYTATPFNSSWANYFGDFCTDPVSGSSYMVESINTGIGGEIIKLNALGTQLIVFPGNVQLEEMWRVIYDNCTKRIIIAGGGVTQTNQAAIIDTNLTTLTAVNVMSTNEIAHDQCFLCMDNSNNVYMASTNYGNPSLNNRMTKVPAATLFPVTWMVADGYNFQEGGNLTYISGGADQANGYNGICVSPNFLYTCDGMDLKKWDKASGALILSVNIAPTPRTCGGMAVDDCDNLYIGVQNSIRKYDVNLVLQSTTPVTNIVYDVRLGPGGKLYCSGLSFVQELQLTGVCNPLTLTVTGSAQCSPNSGTATVVVTGGTGPYTYVWNPGGQTTSTVTGLPSGTYTVTVYDNSCIQNVQTDTVVITTTGNLLVTSQQTNVQCFNSTNGSATVTPQGGQAPYTYVWNPSGQTNATATGLSPGTYSCTVTDATGCSTTQVITITAPPAITAAMSSQPTTCGSNSGTATVTASGGTGPYTYSWAPSGGTGATATGLPSGTFTVTITDANGCTFTSTTTVGSSSNMVPSVASQTGVSCPNSADGTATVSVIGGTAPYTYLWAPTGGTNATATGLSATTYTVTITDANGCTGTQIVTITGPTPVTAAAATTPATCGNSDGSATVTASGGTGPYTYLWSPSGGTGATTVGIPAGTYTVVITDANGCTSTAIANVINGNGPTATVNPSFVNLTGGNSTTLTATGGGSYSWFPTSGLSCTDCPNPVASPTTTTAYCVTVTDAGGCQDSACMIVYVEIPCPTNDDFSVPNAFSPNRDGHNDKFSVAGWSPCMKQYLITIYDRWGEKVFETTDAYDSWDGTYKDKPLDAGVFVYYIQATLLNDTKIVKKGNISLVR
jgi:gliding motility-associated-like protein